MKNCASKKGFSFLEMIIVVAIITIMTMVMMVISFKDRSKKEIEAVAREVTAAIRETQNNALTGRQQGNESLPCSFVFTLSDTGAQYFVKGSYRDIDRNCAPDDDLNSYAKFMLTEDVGTHDMTIKGYDSEGRSSNFVAFTVPYATFIDANSTAEVDPSIGTEFVIAKNGDPRKYHICVHATGLIEEFGFNDQEKDVCPFD